MSEDPEADFALGDAQDYARHRNPARHPSRAPILGQPGRSAAYTVTHHLA